MAELKFHPAMKLTAYGKKLFHELKVLSETSVECGVFPGRSSYPDGTDVGQVAAYNEYGTSTIPARPFVSKAWDDHSGELLKQAAKGFGSLLKGASAESICKEMGEFGVKIIVDEIDNGSFVPNAPSTIAKKGSDHPLIDTGQMKQAVDYEILEKR